MGQSTEELTSQIEGTRQRMAADLDTLQDRVSPSAIVERRKQAVRGRFASAKDKLMGTAHSATGSVSAAASSATGTVSGAGGGIASSAQERIEGTPLAAGLVAFGAGVVLASLVPATRLEAEAAHRVVETAKEQGPPLIDDARSAGQEVADTVKQSATDSAQQVKDSARQSARVVSGEAQTSAEAVRDQASSSEEVGRR
jgi:vacuolar-type H+-ATPase subunit H